MKKITPMLALMAIIAIVVGFACSKNPTNNSDSEVTKIVGATFNSVYVIDSSTFLFIDNNNKYWTVDYQNSSFSEFSSTTGHVNGTDGRLNTTLQDWLKGEKNVIDLPPKDGPGGAPGTITITGILSYTGGYINGIFVASSIRRYGQ